MLRKYWTPAASFWLAGFIDRTWLSKGRFLPGDCLCMAQWHTNPRWDWGEALEDCPCWGSLSESVASTVLPLLPLLDKASERLEIITSPNLASLPRTKAHVKIPSFKFGGKFAETFLVRREKIARYRQTHG